MASINASTVIKTAKKKAPATGATGKMGTPNSSSNNLKGLANAPKRVAAGKGKGAAAPRAVAPKLMPRSMSKPAQISAFQALSSDEQQQKVSSLMRQVSGERGFALPSAPKAESTTSDRGQAAADLAILSKALGIHKVMKLYNVLLQLETTLMPNGIGAIFGSGSTGGMSRIMSSVSLASMASDVSDSIATDLTVASTEKGKITPAPSREGCLLLLRALCEGVGTKSEPFVVPFLAAVLEEAASSQGMVRDAAEDTAHAICALSNPHATTLLLVPVLVQALRSSEWRTKCLALDSLAQLATHSVKSRHICKLLPTLIPQLVPQVWDTKSQVSKAAAACLLQIGKTNVNPDIHPAIPAIVQAMVKPTTHTVAAIEELMGTTFVATVDASTLSLLCPILSRGLKEKMAVHKRATCLVITNMSRLVETPQAVAPFGPLLVPELKKVADNVQFAEIRDAALKALETLTKALGHASIDEAIANVMAAEAKKIEEEQARLQDEADAQVARDLAMAAQEAEERRMWKEAQDASRQLEEIRLQDEADAKRAELKQKTMENQSTKAPGGKCRSCGLKKCKKDCLFAQ